MLRECRRVLRPGGRLLVNVPAYPSFWSQHDEALQHLRRYRRGELEERLAEVGFTVERSQGFNFLLLPVAWTVRRLRRRDADREQPQATTDFFMPSPPLNTAMRGVYLLERWLTAIFPVPFGLSFSIRAVRSA